MVDFMATNPFADISAFVVNILAVVRRTVSGAEEFAGVGVFVRGAVASSLDINAAPLKDFIGFRPELFANERRDGLILIHDPIGLGQKLLPLAIKVNDLDLATAKIALVFWVLDDVCHCGMG